MTNFVTFQLAPEARVHHHAEQQIAIIVSGELTFTVGGETRVMTPGDLVVIPPHVPTAASRARRAASPSTSSPHRGQASCRRCRPDDGIHYDSISVNPLEYRRLAADD